ncbi:hypothetical protein [Herbaspirillum rubrisubalbicans]|uniref:Uncharacterized protein n=1 Tax=Herbaspirillum rubrisubalbicans TaxID=80842 RepID=A0AAD0UBX7_9BURK|nr:hypothetical protein [Herbaspirillum rubrisubalbicans]ALU91701.1 hypothetical protein Hrubri_4556 [Herbaspirillum rubrisubalbicans M1]AYR26670.1 hypothetical protein RC54_23855 [Herbaspirillum rubrisubalbicans]
MTSSPLTDALRAELRAALPILERADSLLGPRLGQVRRAIADADLRRRRYRIHLVERQLLPAISPTTLKRLIDSVPDFVDEIIRASFAQHQRRFIWFGWMAWFAGRPYREALTLMRVRLTRYIDRQRFGQLAAMRDELDRLDGERRALFDASRALGAMMHLIRQSLRNGTDLDQQSWQQLRTLLAQLPPLQPQTARRTQRQDDDDHAALFSFTTSSQGSSLWRDLGQRNHDPDAFQGQFDGGGASGDWDNGKDSSGDTSGPEGKSAAQQERGNAANDMAPVAAAAGAVAIATDDSLGLFS